MLIISSVTIWLPRHCNARHHARSSSVITLGMGRSLIVLVPTCKCFASIDLHSGIYVSRSQSRASIFECSVYSTTSPICRSKSSPRKHSGISLHRHASRSHIRRKARSARNRYIHRNFAALYEILQKRIGIVAIGELPVDVQGRLPVLSTEPCFSSSDQGNIRGRGVMN